MSRDVPVERPTGTYFVHSGRTGLEPSGGCAVGFPVWAITRLRWQFGARSWSIEVSAPWSRKRWNSRLRRVQRWTFDTCAEAEALMPEVIQRVHNGEFDNA